jgi:hypothetical protein
MTDPMPLPELLAALREQRELLEYGPESCLDFVVFEDDALALLTEQIVAHRWEERERCAQIAHLEYLRYAQQGSDRAAGGKEIDADRSYARAGTAKQIATLILDGVEPDIPAALAEANKRIAETEAGLRDLRSAVTSEGEHSDEMIDEEYGDCDICTALRRARTLLSTAEKGT